MGGRRLARHGCVAFLRTSDGRYVPCSIHATALCPIHRITHSEAACLMKYQLRVSDLEVTVETAWSTVA